ncbi:MAG: hypothetical protein K2X43_15470 [Hyphomonadaceae bacterium]|jgi:hypothetical protein|nr:hypothetical protein [Hyphomonadaceae bacterium]
MLPKLKAALDKLLGSLLGSAGGKAGSQAAPVVEYKGYRIIPAPTRAGDQFQTAGAIEKDTPDGVKRHDFIRADTYASWDDAVAFTTFKAKQVIDQQGDRIFK